MGRKHLLDGLIGGELTAVNSSPGAARDNPAPPVTAPHLMSRGAVGAVGRSIEQLRTHSIVELETSLIDPSFVADRLEVSEEHIRALVFSIREHGQQVPILVRPHPQKGGRYQIAFGRRRLLAVIELGRKIRAIIKPLSDEELIIAQGQENSARRDLTFIEKALFAARLEQAGYARETIMAALTVDKTALSRLISAAVKIPQDIIESIGSAPSIGRDRWVALSTQLERSGAMAEARAVAAEPSFQGLSSDNRFDRVLAAVKPKFARTQTQKVLKAGDGALFGYFKEDARTVSVSIDKKIAGDFASHLLSVLPELYASFRQGRSGRT